MTSLVGSSVRMSLCSAARRWGAGVGRLGTMSYGTTASTMPFSETQRHACMFTGASRPFPSPSLGAAACPGSNTAVRRFSSVGMGGSRGGGSMVDITAGSVPGDDENFPRLSGMPCAVCGVSCVPCTACTFLDPSTMYQKSHALHVH